MNYRIFNRVYRSSRKRDVTFGAQDRIGQLVLVGTGPHNSHEFADIVISRDDIGGADRFRLYVDGELIKSAIVRKGDYQQL
jgi:hypothetical protein